MSWVNNCNRELKNKYPHDEIYHLSTRLHHLKCYHSWFKHQTRCFLMISQSKCEGDENVLFLSFSWNSVTWFPRFSDDDMKSIVVILSRRSMRVLRCFYKDLMIFFNVVWVSVNGFGLINLRINLRDFAVSEKSFKDSLAITDQEKLINILDDFYSSSFYSLHALRSLRSSTIESYR